jgi:acetyltransferase-like isoleucine patch superfamily enzyme
MIEYGNNSIGPGSRIFDNVIVGFPSRDRINAHSFEGATIGARALIRSGTIIYSDVQIGDDFSTGHNVLIRENTVIGKRVSLGTATVIEGHTIIGDDVNIQSMVYVPMHTLIGDGVFIGPNAVLTNDRYPPHGGEDLKGPIIEDAASVGANATILPGVVVGTGALVAAGAIVTKDVPPHMLAIGSPARWKELPEESRGRIE